MDKMSVSGSPMPGAGRSQNVEKLIKEAKEFSDSFQHAENTFGETDRNSAKEEIINMLTKKVKNLLGEKGEETTRKSTKNISSSIPPDLQVANGVELQIRHAFGFTTNPISSTIHFITNECVMFLLGQYLCKINIHTQEQEFISVSSNMSTISNLYVGCCIHQNCSGQHLIVYGEDPQLLHLMNINSCALVKKIFTFGNSNKHTGKRTIVTQHVPTTPPMGLGEIARGSPTEPKYLSRVVLSMFKGKKKCILYNVFDEPAKLTQIHITCDKLAYLLYTNNTNGQIFVIWNYKKEIILILVELKKCIKKFTINPKNQTQIVCCADKYLKYLDINLTNKLVRENTPNLVPMKVERVNNFIDIEYITNTDILISISKSNNVFIFKDFQLIYQINNFQVITAIIDPIGMEEDNSDMEDVLDPQVFPRTTKPAEESTELFSFREKYEALLPKTEIRSTEQRHSAIAVQYLRAKEGEFETLKVGPRGFYLGSKGGFVSVFDFVEFTKPPVHMGTHRLPGDILDINSIIIPPNNSVFGVLAYYQMEEGQGREILKDMRNPNPYTPNLPWDRETTPLDPKSRGVTLSQTLERAPDAHPTVNLDFLFMETRRMMEKGRKEYKRLFMSGLHEGGIYGMASCKQRSILACISDGKNLRIWAHSNEWKGVNNYYLNDQPLSIDIHPTGFQLVLGYLTSFRIYFLGENSLVQAQKRSTKSSMNAKYNPGGNYLAVTDANTILIFDTIQFLVLAALNGHSGLIRSLAWSPDGDLLLSSCNGSTILCWNAIFRDYHTQYQVLPLHRGYFEGLIFTQIVYDHIDFLVAAITDRSIFTLKKSIEIYFEKFDHKPIALTLSTKLKVLFVAFAEGFIRIYNWPLLPNTAEEYNLLIDYSGISEIHLTKCERYLFVGCENGTLYVLEVFGIIENIEYNSQKMNPNWEKLYFNRSMHGIKGYSPFDMYDLVNTNAIRTLHNKIRSLESKDHQVVEFSRINLSYKTGKLKDLKLELTQKYQADLYVEMKDWQKMEEEQKREMEQMESRVNQLKQEFKEELDKEKDGFKKTLDDANERNEEVMYKIGSMKEKYRGQLRKIEKEHSLADKTLRKAQNESLDKVRREIEELKKKYIENGNFHDQILSTLEQDYEAEIKRTLMVINQQILSARKKNEDTCEECIIMKKEVEKVIRENNEVEKEAGKHQSNIYRIKDEKEKIGKREKALEEQIQSCGRFIENKEGLLNSIIWEKQGLEATAVLLQDRIEAMEQNKAPLDLKRQEFEDYVGRAYTELVENVEQKINFQSEYNNRVERLSATQKAIQLKTSSLQTIDDIMMTYKKEIKRMFVSDAGNHGFSLNLAQIIEKIQNTYSPSLLEITAAQSIQKSDKQDATAESNMQLMAQVKLVKEKNRVVSKVHEVSKRNRKQQKTQDDQVCKMHEQTIQLLSERNSLKQQNGRQKSQVKLLESQIIDTIEALKDKFGVNEEAVKILLMNFFIDISNDFNENKKLGRSRSTMSMSSRREDVRGFDGNYRIRTFKGSMGSKDMQRIVSDFDRNREELLVQDSKLNTIRRQSTELLKGGMKGSVGMGTSGTVRIAEMLGENATGVKKASGSLNLRQAKRISRNPRGGSMAAVQRRKHKEFPTIDEEGVSKSVIEGDEFEGRTTNPTTSRTGNVHYTQRSATSSALD